MSDEKGVRGDLPLVLGLLLVVKVGVFELGADVQSQGELIMGFLWLLVADEIEDFWTRNRISALGDDCVANLSDQNNQSGWSVVVLGISPNEEDSVHDWEE